MPELEVCMQLFRQPLMGCKFTNQG